MKFLQEYCERRPSVGWLDQQFSSFSGTPGFCLGSGSLEEVPWVELLGSLLAFNQSSSFQLVCIVRFHRGFKWQRKGSGVGRVAGGEALGLDLQSSHLTEAFWKFAVLAPCFLIFLSKLRLKLLTKQDRMFVIQQWYPKAVG